MAEGNNPTTSGSGGAGDDSSSGHKRKIAGKYDSIEEAVEKGILGMENAFHSTREEVGAIKQLLERTMQPIGSRGQEADYNDDSYGRGRRARDDEDDFDETEFIASPKKIIKQREARLAKHLEQRLANQNRALINNTAQVLRWQMQNQDLDEHESLVEGFYKKTDPNKTVFERLKDAGKQTRTYLKKLKGDNEDDDAGRSAGRNPNSDEFVEGSAGAGRGGNRQKSNDDDANSNDNSPGSIYGDAELASEIEERRRFKSSRFQAKSSK
jgi:hypothetical protein